MEKFIKSYYDYLLKEKHFSLHSDNSYMKDVETFLDFADDEISNVNEINYKHIRQWIVFLSAKKRNNSINRKIASLKVILNFFT